MSEFEWKATADELAQARARSTRTAMLTPDDARNIITTLTGNNTTCDHVDASNDWCIHQGTPNDPLGVLIARQGNEITVMFHCITADTHHKAVLRQADATCEDTRRMVVRGVAMISLALKP